jgi:hypothetical protein
MKKYIVEISGELVSIYIVELVEMSFEEIVGIFFGELQNTSVDLLLSHIPPRISTDMHDKWLKLD